MLNPARRIVIAVVLTSAVANDNAFASPVVWLGLGGSGCGRRSSIRRLLRLSRVRLPRVRLWNCQLSRAGRLRRLRSYATELCGPVLWLRLALLWLRLRVALLSDLSASSSLIAGPAYASDPKRSSMPSASTSLSRRTPSVFRPSRSPRSMSIVGMRRKGREDQAADLAVRVSLGVDVDIPIARLKLPSLIWG